MKDIHIKSFFIGRYVINASGLVHIKHGKWHVSYDASLPVFANEDKSIILFGDAWQVMPEKGSPEEEIGELGRDSTGKYREQDILDMENSWCGRYVLLACGKVYTDLCGLMGIFYSDYGVSNNAALLAREAGLNICIYKPNGSMNWMPGPLTQYPHVMRLMPSQAYSLSGGIPLPRKLLPKYEDITDNNSRIQEFSALYCQSLQNMAAHFPGKHIAIMLTGGYDSRTMMALAEKAGLEYSCVTFEREEMEEGDRSIPPLLADAVGRHHDFIPRNGKEYTHGKDYEYLRHISGSAWDEDRMFHAYGQFDELRGKYGDCLLLRGSVWGCATEYLMDCFMGKSAESDIAVRFGVEPGSIAARSVRKYLDWCSGYPQDGISLCGRFFLEQREGCWLSAIEQGFDVIPGMTPVQPLNSRLLLSILLGFSNEERVTKRHEEEITAYACPELAGIRHGSAGNGGRASRLIKTFTSLAWKTVEYGPVAVTSYAWHKIWAKKYRERAGKENDGRKENGSHHRTEA